MMWKKLVIGLIIVSAFVGLGWFWVSQGLQRISVPDAPAAESQQTSPEFSLTDPNSLWVIVNKHNSMPESYVPKDLAPPPVRLRLNANEEQMKLAKRAHKDLRAMFQAAEKDGIVLVFGSGYRSGELQREFYTEYVTRDGQGAADRLSARPGHSEHQTGLSADIVSADSVCYLEACWAKTKEGKWLTANAHNYGFIIRYPNKKESITGYKYEPWHIRYVGRDLSNKVYQSGQTLEEYFGLEPAPDYK